MSAQEIRLPAGGRDGGNLEKRNNPLKEGEV